MVAESGPSQHPKSGLQHPIVRALVRGSRRQFLPLPGWAVRVLSLYGCLGMYAYFVLKNFFAPDRPVLIAIGGPLLITAIVALVVVFASTYSFIAFASHADIDERELAERNAAFAFSFHYLVGGLLLAVTVGAAAEKYRDWQPSMQLVENFALVITLTGLAMPAAVMAWRERRAIQQDQA